MNLIVFLTRAFAGLIFIFLIGMSIDPTLSGTDPDWHPNSAATVASIILTTLYLWPLIAEAKRGKVVARMPTSKSFTGRRFLTFGRWYLAFSEGMLTIVFFFELQFSCGILSLIIVAGLMPPVDRLLFAPGSEMTARLKSNSIFLKVFPNLGALTSIIAIGTFGQKNYTATIYILGVSVCLMLVVPIVLLAKGGWKALSLKPTLLPVAVSGQSFEAVVSRPVAIQKSPIPVTTPTKSPRTTQALYRAGTRHKYFSAKAWYWN